jgi:hypothetical protein
VMSYTTAAMLVKVGGYASLGWLIFHLAFWRLFDWNAELRRLSFVNRSVMQVLNLCLSFVFLLFAVLSLRHTNELLGAVGVGRTLLAGIGVFWLLRLVEQPLFFKFSWRSNAFSLLFVAMSACYLLPLALR